MHPSHLERIPKVCVALRDVGLAVSVREEVAVRDVLLALAASGESPKTAEDLRDALRPVLCRSRDQIRTYEDIFAEVFPQSLVPVGPGPKKRKAPKPIRWARGFLIASVLFVLAGAGIWTWKEFGPKPEPTTPAEPDIEVPGPDANELTIPAPVSAESANSWPSWLPHVVGAGGVLAVLLTFFAFLTPNKHRYLNRRLLDAVEDAENDVLFQVPIRSPFPEGVIRACALELRKHRDIDLLDHLDVPATVRASVRRGGWFTPVGRRFKRTPEYLILIQQLSGADHRGRLARYLAAQLRAEGVPVNVWTFRHEPDILYPENDDGTANALSLEQLHVRMPDHRLLIFSEYSAFRTPQSALGLWEQGGAWFADRHPDLAAFPGSLLAAPAGAAGLEAYTAVLRGERASLRAMAPGRGMREELPVLLTADRGRWTEVRPPSSGTIAAGLEVLEDYLGAGGMFWLRACAAYPELDWNLTVALGRELDDRIAKSARPDLLNRLIALPWFQEGAMPQWLRRALLRPLRGPERKEIHRALNRILVEGAAEVTGDPAVRNEVHQLIANNPSLIDRLARKLKRREPGAGWKERTVVETFGGEGALRILVPVPDRGWGVGWRWGIAVMALVGVGYWWGMSKGGAEGDIAKAFRQHLAEFTATNGNVLEVAVKESREDYGESSVMATFRYHIMLDGQWTLRQEKEHDGTMSLIVIAPKIEPTLPVAFDSRSLEAVQDVGLDEIEALRTNLTRQLEETARSQDSIDSVREASRHSIGNFVMRWADLDPIRLLQETGIPLTNWEGVRVVQGKGITQIKVYFSDEDEKDTIILPLKLDGVRFMGRI